MYKQPSWYKNKHLNLAQITDQQLTAFRDEMDRVYAENTRIHAKAADSIRGLLASAQKIYVGDHPVIKAIRKSLKDLEPVPSYAKAYDKLTREVVEARQCQRRNAQKREYYRRQKQLMSDLDDAAILECGDPAGPYQPEALGERK